MLNRRYLQCDRRDRTVAALHPLITNFFSTRMDNGRNYEWPQIQPRINQPKSKLNLQSMRLMESGEARLALTWVQADKFGQ
jgi:hypothetical protein